MDNGVIVTSLIGVVTTFTSGWTAWFFARKRYNSEVDNNLIANMSRSLEFYQQLSDDNKQRLIETLERSEALEQELKELRQQVLSLMTVVCTDLTCQLRKGNYEEVINRRTTLRKRSNEIINKENAKE